MRFPPRDSHGSATSVGQICTGKSEMVKATVLNYLAINKIKLDAIPEEDDTHEARPVVFRINHQSDFLVKIAVSTK